LWCVFIAALLAAMIGLGVLSQHALRLGRAQWLAQQRESLEQDVRVALWRLDSRLAPYLATLHDSVAGETGSADDFVLKRFRVVPSSIKGGTTQYSYTPLPGIGRPAAVDAGIQIGRQLPIDQLVASVKQLLPDFEQPETSQSLIANSFSNQSLVQSYRINAPGQQQSPLDRELDNRAMAVQRQMAQANNLTAAVQPFEVRLAPIWMNQQLILVRSRTDRPQMFDGVWLDWPAIKTSLAGDVADLLPAVDFTPISHDQTPDPSRALAALPAAIVPAAVTAVSPPWSPTHTALLLSWLGLLAAALVAAVAVSRLIALSERRASFVSAVTHELRTPLTTFRLYSDLLARDMVSDPEDRKEYLQTLRREADRLTHLVDNVLRYSRLERSARGPVLETIRLSEWIQRITPRLAERLKAADMQLLIEQPADGSWSTDPAALEQVLFNLIDNAAKYAKHGPDQRVQLFAGIDDKQVTLIVTDHGNGVPPELRATMFKPFAKSAERAADTAAGVGLGLALARQTAAALGGTLTYQQTEQGGASFQLTLPRRRST
jgi:signal transduction histidine kinase